MQKIHHNSSNLNDLNDNNNIINNNENLSSSSRAKSTTVSNSTIIFSIERDLTELKKELTTVSQKTQLQSIIESIKLLKKRLSSKNCNITQSQIQNNSHNNSEIILTNYSNEQKPNRSLTFKHSKTLGSQCQNEENNNNNNILRRSFHTNQSNNQNITQPIKASCNYCDKYCKEISKLKNDINSLQNKLNVCILKKEEKVKQEKEKNFKDEYNELMIKFENNQITNAKIILEYKNKLYNTEQALRTLSEEYDNLCKKIGDMKEKNDMLNKKNTKIQKSLSDCKSQLNEVVNANQQLSQKMANSMKNQYLLGEELKNTNNQKNKLAKINNELSQRNKLLCNELGNREQRLNALREMNNNLENKATKLVKKCEKITINEEGDIHKHNEVIYDNANI